MKTSRKSPLSIAIIPEGEGQGQKKYRGLMAGKHHYYFLHGQQFDILFICSTFLRDYPGWVAKNC